MVSRLAFCILSTCIITGRATVIVVASLGQRTLAVIDAFSSGTSDKRISPVACWASTHGPVCPRPVESSLALSSWTAWVWVAQIFLLERTAADERISSKSFGTAADGLVVGRLAVCALSAHIRVGLAARILTLEAHAGLAGVAVGVAGALRVAAGVGVAEEILWTCAGGAVVPRLAVGVLPAHSLLAGRDAAVRLPVAFLGLAAGLVAVALVSASGQGVADVGGFAFADGTIVFTNCAVGVGTARGADLVTGEPATVSEWISRSSPGTPTDGHMVPDSAVCSLAAGDAAGIHALVVLAGLLSRAIRVLVAFSLDAPSVGVSLMSCQTFTDGPSSHIPALCSRPTNAWNAWVGPAPGAAVGTSHISSQTFANASLTATAAVGIGAA